MNTVMDMSRVPAVWLMSLVLVSCSSMPVVDRLPGMDRVTGENALIQDRQGDYLEAETIPRTRIPAGMDSYIIDDLYIIPELGEDAETTAFLQAPRPRPLRGRTDNDVVIQRLDERSWVVVNASPSQVWPRIRDYWAGQDVELSFENPTAGLMETGWFVEENNSLTQEKFRIRVEPGFQDESSEIKLTHMSLPQAIPAFEQVSWPEKSEDLDKEYERLTDLAEYLAANTELYQASTVSFLAGNIPSKGKATMIEGAGGPQHIRLDADSLRSWGAIARALETAGVEIVTRDQEAGVFEVNYTLGAREEDPPGFIGKLNPFRGDDGTAGVTYKMRVELNEVGGIILVEVENLSETDAESEEPALQPEASLLQTIMSNLA